MVVQERRGNLKSRSRVNFKLSEKPRPSIKKCQKLKKSLSGGNGSTLRTVNDEIGSSKFRCSNCLQESSRERRGVSSAMQLVICPDSQNFLLM